MGSGGIALEGSTWNVGIIECSDSREIASPLGGSGNQTREGDAPALELLFAVEEEESLVLDDGSAERTAELVEIELFRSFCEEALCVERLVAEKFEERAMEIVAPGFGGDEDGRSRAEAV